MNLSRMLNKSISSFLTTLSILMLSSILFAQSGTSSISGTVTDGQGNAVPGATVVLISAGQNTQRTTTADNNGKYTFTAVAPGVYTVETTAGNFKKSSITGVQALVDKNTTIPVTLEVGEVSAVVTITADSIENIINTQDGSLGNNFVARQISQLPLEGRNVADLLSLQPGVTPGGYVAGGRSDQANITLDGVDVNNQQEGTAFTPVLRVTPDSIEEFRVTTLNPDATKGRSAGAQISLITKSGSNDFHGNLFYYHRNDYFNANEWYNNASNEPRPKWLRHLFGGSLGGPIVKDRAFFFYNYEGMRETRGIPVTQIVPLPSLGQGIMKFFDSTGVLRSADTTAINSFTATGNVAVVNVNPNAVNLFAAAAARYPSNTSLAGDGINTGGFRFNSIVPTNENTHTARIDYAITRDQKHNLSARVNFQFDSAANTTAFPDTPQTSTISRPYGGAATWTWLINSNVTNRFSYGLTKLAFRTTAEVDQNAITFRDIFAPYNYTRAFSRDNPTYNYANDTTWLVGNHTFQFGTNIRLIRNHRINDAAAYHSAVANFGFIANSGSQATSIVNRYATATWGTTVGSQSIRSAQSSLVALTGRLNQYTARQSYDLSGNPVSGPSNREYATEEFDFYVQDSWKIAPTLTLTFGLRYGYSTPVYETRGMETAPNIALDEYFARRLAAAEDGENYDEPLTIELSGKRNGMPPMYNPDKNNFQPRVSVAWAPKFEDGIGAFIFGKTGQGVLRGGFAITNDYYGQQLAVSFDAANTLGFLQQWTRAANQSNLTTNPGVFWDGTNMDIRNFPLVNLPASVHYPLLQPQDGVRRIESSIDRGIQAPINYTYNVTFGRDLPGKMYFEGSFIGRNARNLLARRDVMTPNNLRDPVSGMTYYEAATILAQHAYAGGFSDTAPVVPFFENMWPGLGASQGFGSSTEMFAWWVEPSTDWSFGQDVFDFFSDNPLFYQSQYGALDSFGSISNSDYYAATFSLRQRLSNLTWDFNYTYSQSKDDTSGLQTSGSFGSAFILNPIRQRDNYSWSDFDMRHAINFNAIWQLPFGKGQPIGSNVNGFVDALIGGWQLTSIFRYNSGQPHGTSSKIFDNSGWATNWNLKSAMVQVAPIETGVFFNGSGGLPTMFSDATAAYRSFRSPYPGETGDRNLLRWPGFWNLDMGLQKSFTMPWYENHKLSFRWDVFNVTNNVVFVGNANTAMGFRPQIGNAPAGYGQFNGTRTDARVMQFALRYEF